MRHLTAVFREQTQQHDKLDADRNSSAGGWHAGGVASACWT